MLILKHVEYKIRNSRELKKLLSQLRETISKVNGVEFKDIYFPKGMDEFILVMDCVSEDKYLEWRDICPRPPGAKDWYEILLTKDEQFHNKDK
ncbi:MAG: hypothetical protein ACE5IT_05045 [bacterium]